MGILFPTVIIFNNDKGVLNYSFLFSLNSFSEKLILFIFLISLAGLPPLAGFYLKMIVIFLLLSHRINVLPCLFNFVLRSYNFHICDTYDFFFSISNYKKK